MANMAGMQSNTPGVTEIFELMKSDHCNTAGSQVVRDLYDKCSSTYEKETADLAFTGPNQTGIILSDHCPDRNISIVDCGAGSGLVGVQLNTLGYKNVVGVDISQKILEIAEQKGVYKNLFCVTVGEERMPFGDNEFDALVCCGCIAPAHISPSCFPEWVRIVRPGGSIVIVLRRCYVELQKDEEEFYSQSLGESFEANIRHLEDSKKWKAISKKIFSGYLTENGHANDGIGMVFEVL